MNFSSFLLFYKNKGNILPKVILSLHSNFLQTLMPCRSSNFEVAQLLDTDQVSQLLSDSNDFGSFIYRDHVTRKKYDVQELKQLSSVVSSIQSLPLVHKHKYNKSMGSIPKNKSRFNHKNEEIEQRKEELSHFLQELVMMNRIRTNRNHIISGTEKAMQRKSMLPSLMHSLDLRQKKQHNIDLLKQKIRKQVNSLNTELFRQYIHNIQPFRPVFNELNIISSKGAINTNKIKKIKQKIKECTKINNQTNTNASSIIKKQQLDDKVNQFYEEYFTTVSKQIDQEIHLKMKHQASFNWKYGRKTTIEELFNTYKLQSKFKSKQQ